jgi:nucleotide-binding universal stress UspA family protein
MTGPILCGYDGTAASVGAIRFASALGERLGAAVTAVTVDGTWPESEGAPLAAAPPGPGIPGLHRWYVSARSPGLGLHDVARLTRAWLLVLGGRPGGGRVGRVHHALLNGSPCAVAVVPENTSPQRAGGAVAVGWNGAADGLVALDFAQELAEGLDAGLLVLHAPAPEHPADLEAAIADRSAPGGVRTRLLVGDPAEALAHAVDDVSLLVLGPRGTEPAGTVLLGRVSGAMVDSAPCPTVVVPRARAAVAS